MSVWPNGSTTVPHVSSEFGPRKAPTKGASTNHLGMDLTGFTYNRAAVAGVIVMAGYNGGSGNEVRLQGDDGIQYRYKHHASIMVRVGQRVVEGQALGVMGKTGTATGVHVHFEVVIGGVQRNPRDYVGKSSAPASSGGVVKGFSLQVQQQQQYLNARFGEKLKEDGRLGPATRAAIARYQRVLGIKADGIWGNDTQAHHAAYTAPKAAPAAVSTATGTLAAVQYALKTKYPAYAGHLKIDNINGPQTRAAVKEFQRRSGLVPDGIAGPKTRRALGI